MAKVNIPTISSGFASTTVINSALDTIESELNNKVLYRNPPNGEPNQMEADLDMNGHRIYNILASSGDGFIWEGSWSSSTEYVLNNLVTYSGSSYICLVSHTSTTVFEDDLAASKWEIVASKGDSGAGTGDMLKSENLIGLSSIASARTNIGAAASGANTDITSLSGKLISDLADLTVDQTWTGAQRGSITTDNDGSFDQSASNNFFCTPTGAVALTFTNHTSGQSGLVLFVNSSNYAITAAATTYIAAADLTKLSATGTYLIAYLDNGTNAYCTVTAALTSAGA